MQRSSGVALMTLGICLVACETSSTSQLRSNWDVLRQAKAQSCESLPRTDKEISVQSAKPLSGSPTILMLQYLSRAGSSTLSYVPFDGENKLAPEALKPLNLTSSTMFLGGGMIHGRLYTVVANSFGGRNKLELRSLDTQNVEMSADWAPGLVKPVAFQAVGDRGFWLAYKVPKQDESIEDQGVSLIHVRKDVKGQGLVIRQFKLPSQITRIQLVSPAPDRVLVLWAAETKAPEGIRTLFKAQELFDNGGSSPAQDLKFQARGTIESWAAASTGAKLYLTFVQGDSLMGEASLRTVRVDWRSVGSKVIWDKSKLLPHEHVADPQILPTKAGVKVILLKWLDRESTLGLYGYDLEGNMNDVPYGVFPEGTQLTESFYDSAHDSFHAILRQKAGLTEDLVLCGLP